MRYLVYITTNKLNNKKYVGVHSTKNVNDSYLGSGKFICKAINEFGRENFERKILFDCDSKEEAYWLEGIIIPQWLISCWGNGKYFYNSNHGGGSRYKSHSPTHKEYLEVLKGIHKDITPLEEYKTSEDKIKHKHNCGYVWNVAPYNLLRNKGCPNCR